MRINIYSLATGILICLCLQGCAHNTYAPVVDLRSPVRGVWVWPAKGELINGHALRSGRSMDLHIAGKEGDPVRAAADGEVIYSGSELRGYGQLVIIQHNAKYVTTYAHNRELLVSKGDRVYAGQQIARMGSVDTHRTQLVFEIRESGRPVDPFKYLPS